MFHCSYDSLVFFLYIDYNYVPNRHVVFSFLAFILAAAGLVIVGYVGSSKLNSVLYLSFSVGFSGMAMAGFNINHIDLAPQYAGILMGITNSVATIPGIIGPLIAKTIAHKVS